MLRTGVHYQPAEVLPHRGAMLLLDSIRDYGDDWLVAEVRVRKDSNFGTPDGVPSWVGIEYMAQAVSAWSGIGQVQNGGKPGIGLLLGSRRYQARRPLFAVGSHLRVRARLVWRDTDDLAAFDCAIEEDGEAVAHAQLKVYRPRDLDAVLKELA
ncbi:MAG: ApeP family dehydratase [Gammaproteobacteria bacterium]